MGNSKGSVSENIFTYKRYNDVAFMYMISTMTFSEFALFLAATFSRFFAKIECLSMLLSNWSTDVPGPLLTPISSFKYSQVLKLDCNLNIRK